MIHDPSWRDAPNIRALPDRERGELEAWLLEQVLRRAVAYAHRPELPGRLPAWPVPARPRDRPDPVRGLVLQQRAILRERLDLGATGTDWTHRLSRRTPRSPIPWLDAYLRGVLAEPLHAREALGFYLDSLTTRPDFFWGHYRAACVAYRIDAYSLAIESLRACVARRPKNEMLRNLLASTMYTLGRYAVPDAKLINLADAQAECDEALALNPDFAPATRTRSRINQLLGQTDGVRSDVERFSLLTRATKPVDSLLLQLLLKASPGEAFPPLSADEETSLRRAISADDKNLRAKTCLADFLVEEGRTDETLRLYDDAIASDPDHLNARFERAVELVKAGQATGYDELFALVDHPRFEEIYSYRPAAFRIFNHLSRYLLESGQLAAAERMIQRGWTAVHLSDALRDDVVAARGEGRPPVRPRGEMHYHAARVDVVAARSDPRRLSAAVAHLKIAFAESSLFRTQWFPLDRFFDEYRTLILQQIEQRPDH